MKKTIIVEGNKMKSSKAQRILKWKNTLEGGVNVMYTNGSWTIKDVCTYSEEERQLSICFAHCNMIIII